MSTFALAPVQGSHSTMSAKGKKATSLERPLLGAKHLQPNFHVAEHQQQTYPSEHNNVITPCAPNRVALEFGFGRTGARWYVPSSID
jgi:hypothetical protein